MTDDVSESILRLTTATPNGVTGFSVLRGYARPYSGPAPITTVDSTINNISGSTGKTTIHGNEIKHSLFVFDSAFDTSMHIKFNNVTDHDWVVVDFFSLLKLVDRKSVVKGKRVSVGLVQVVSRIIK